MTTAHVLTDGPALTEVAPIRSRAVKHVDPRGQVALVGAGPGDPGLVTVRAAELLARADLVLADAGTEAVTAVHVRDGALAGPEVTEADLVAAAAAGQQVVRLLGGDPFGALENGNLALTVQKARIRLEVVPGVPPSVGVPTYAGIPVGLPRTVATFTPDGFADAVPLVGTLLLTGPASGVPVVAGQLLEAGMPASTKVVATVGGTTTGQRTQSSTLSDLTGVLAGLGLDGHSSTSVLLVVGGAWKAKDRLTWWEGRPLHGWRVLVPRTREQAGSVAALLRAQGADPLEVPTIGVEPPRTATPMERAVRGLATGRYAWVAFTSANAVRAIADKLEESGLDARAFAGVKVAVVGEAIAAAVRALGIKPDLAPTGDNQNSEGLLAEWPDRDPEDEGLDRILLPRADIATETLVAGVKERGWTVDDVTAYRTVRASPPPAPVRDAIKSGGLDAAIFTSSSTVRNLIGIAGKPHERTVIAVIGPATRATAEELGLRVDVQAAEASVASLVQALADFAASRGEDEPRPSQARRRAPRR